MEAELFECLKAVNDASSAATSTDFWAAKLHRIDTVSLEANIFNTALFARRFLRRGCLNDGGTGLSSEEK